MLIDGRPYRTLWMQAEDCVCVIDQRLLPWRLEVLELRQCAQVAAAIADMAVRGAGLIGATAAHGMMLAAREAQSPAQLQSLAGMLIATRPTAVNLAWAVKRVQAAIERAPWSHRAEVARAEAATIADEDAAACAAIGQQALPLLKTMAATKPQGEPLRVLTHCNAGWLAFVDHGSATAPLYAAQAAGLSLEVWVDETRPRNQGARLTAWELQQQGIASTLIADNLGGQLMREGRVDLVIVGADRVARNGDVANKVGTYLKALAARDNGVAFWVALPCSTLDASLANGDHIPIEERSPRELSHIEGMDESGQVREVQLCAPNTQALNLGFDVTPARLVDRWITEHGVFDQAAALFAAAQRH